MFISDNMLIKSQLRQCGRVVKALASKANGFSRAGSNPAVVVLFTQRNQTDNYLILPQFNLDELTKAIQTQGFETNIETSGSSPLSGSWNWICLSPKKFKAPLPEILPLANELKIVVFNKTDFDWAEKYAAQVNSNCKLYLQPEWDKAATVTPLIIDYIKANPKWRLSLQIHKYINVP